MKNGKRFIEEQTGAKAVAYEYKHTIHSFARASQRGIDNDLIQMALCYGQEFFRQGMIFIAVQSHHLPDSIDERMRRRLKNLVVVLGNNARDIVTCFWATNSLKYIKRKGVKLY